MRSYIFFTLSLSLMLFFFWSCASNVEKPQSTTVKKSQPAATTPSGKTGFDHKSSRDSVDWGSLSQSGEAPEVKETDLEWPGERLGLIGPIIASGGSGSRQFIVVFDPAGIPVGVLTRKAYKKDPTQLANLLAKAQVRSKIQNTAILAHLMKRQASEGRPAQTQPDQDQ